MTITMSKTREQFALSTRKITKKMAGAVIGWGMLFVPVFLFCMIFAFSSRTTEIQGWYWTGVFVSGGVYALLIGITYWYQCAYFNTYFYDLTEHFIIIRKGVIIPKEINIPYERVQDVYVDQDLFDRILGIYDVHLSTATIASGMAAHIDGVEKAPADGLRAHLLQTISAKIGRRPIPTSGAVSPPPTLQN